MIYIKSVIDKIIEDYKSQLNTTKNKLVIITDNNKDNISYINGIHKINTELHLFEHFHIVNLDLEEKESKGWLYTITKNDYIYIMNSCYSRIKDNIDFYNYKYIFTERKEEDNNNNNLHSNFHLPLNTIYPTAECIKDIISECIHYEHDNINVVLCNRSELIGRPLINKIIKMPINLICLNSGTLAADQEYYFQRADIIITAVGKPNLFKLSKGFEGNPIIIDAGINVVDGKVCGDWDYESLKDKTVLITPNPGGVGKLTSYRLLYDMINMEK